jgi:hypothetical protein
MEYCTACGTPLGQDWAFCRRCGRPVDGVVAPVAEAQVPTNQPWSLPGSRQAESNRLTTWDVAAAVLLLAGVGLGIGALFPDFYHNGRGSLASHDFDLVYNIINFGGWAIAGILILLHRRGIGAWLAAGVTVMTLGLYLVDTGFIVRYGTHLAATGFWLGQSGWLVCASGTGVALFAARKAGMLGGIGLGPVALPLAAAVAGIATAVAFVPFWDRLHFVVPSTGRSGTIARPGGNAFHNPGTVIAAYVVILTVLVLAPIVATLLRPGTIGAAALLGLIVPQVANLVSEVAFLLGSVDPTYFGASRQQAASAHAVLSLQPTPWFWAEAAALGLLLLVFLARVLTIRPHESS